MKLSVAVIVLLVVLNAICWIGLWNRYQDNLYLEAKLEKAELDYDVLHSQLRKCRGEE